ncbi:MAG: hypothetical protein OXQ90_19610, partial [Gammaproteobacteria bacterium]|nr:hypothetical protein [Gammaproteobacteria bacterium]
MENAQPPVLVFEKGGGRIAASESLPGGTNIALFNPRRNVLRNARILLTYTVFRRRLSPIRQYPPVTPAVKRKRRQ